MMYSLKGIIILISALSFSVVDAQGTFSTVFTSYRNEASSPTWAVDLPNLTFFQYFTAGSTPPFLLSYSHDNQDGTNIQTCKFKLALPAVCSVDSGTCGSCIYEPTSNKLNISFPMGKFDVGKNQSTIRYTLPASGISDVMLVTITLDVCTTTPGDLKIPLMSSENCGYGCSIARTVCDKPNVKRIDNATCQPDATWSEPTVKCDLQPIILAIIIVGVVALIIFIVTAIVKFKGEIPENSIRNWIIAGVFIGSLIFWVIGFAMCLTLKNGAFTAGIVLGFIGIAGFITAVLLILFLPEDGKYFEGKAG